MTALPAQPAPSHGIKQHATPQKDPRRNRCDRQASPDGKPSALEHRHDNRDQSEDGGCCGQRDRLKPQHLVSISAFQTRPKVTYRGRVTISVLSSFGPKPKFKLRQYRTLSSVRARLGIQMAPVRRHRRDDDRQWQLRGHHRRFRPEERVPIRLAAGASVNDRARMPPRSMPVRARSRPRRRHHHSFFGLAGRECLRWYPL